MKLNIDIIDADPAERDRVDSGDIENYKRYKIKNNKSPLNHNVKLLADGLANALERMIEDVFITIEHSCIERSDDLSYISELVISDDSTDDSEDFRKHVWSIIAAFSGKVATLVVTEGRELFPLESHHMMSDKDEILLDEISDNFILKNKATKFSRNVVIRMNKFLRMTVGVEWVKPPAGTRKIRAHQPIRGRISNIDIFNRIISIQPMFEKKQIEVILGNDFLERLPPLINIFEYQDFKIHVEDNFHEAKNDSELHIIDIEILS